MESAGHSRNLTRSIIIAAVLGVLAGMMLGSDAGKLGSLGMLLIQLIKAIALPLVFVAIVEGVISTHIPKSSALKLFVVAAINAIIAASIGLAISNYFQAGSGLQIASLTAEIHPTKSVKAINTRLDFVSIISGYIPESFLAPFVQSNMISVVLLAILMGAAARAVSLSPSPEIQQSALVFHSFFSFLFRVIEKILFWLVNLVPIAVFGVIASVVGEQGFQPFKSLLIYAVAALLGLGIQSFIIYSLWIKYYARLSLRAFWREAKKPVIYAFGVNSSLATLPLTLKALDNLKISRASSRLGACVGTNFNNDGILLYEAMAVLFTAQALGMSLPLGEQISVAVLCMITAMGVAGVPEAGIVALSLVLTSVGMSLEILPLLLTVDWLIARARSVTNVLSDMTLSIAIEGPREAR